MTFCKVLRCGVLWLTLNMYFNVEFIRQICFFMFSFDAT